MHVHAALFSFLTLTVPLQVFATDAWITVAELVVFVGMFVYLASALRRVFGGTRAEAFRRAAVIAAAQIVIFAGVLAGVFFVLMRLNPAGL
jgi:hypothetical protein